MIPHRQYFSVTAIPDEGMEQYFSAGQRFTRSAGHVVVVPEGETPKVPYEITQAQLQELRNDPRIKLEPANGPEVTSLGPAPITPDNAHIHEARMKATAAGETVVHRDAEGKSAMDRQQEAWSREQAELQGKIYKDPKAAKETEAAPSAPPPSESTDKESGYRKK